MAYKYKDYQLKLVWDYVRNNHRICDLWNKANYAEKVANEMYYQAYNKFGLDKPVFKVNGEEMPKPNKGPITWTVKKKVKKLPKPIYFEDDVTPRPATKLYSAIEPPDVSIFAKTERPPDEYTNGGYIALQKKYGS